jgi:hypothetical protein
MRKEISTSPVTDTPRHPKLTPEQLDGILAELLVEYQLNNLRPQQKGGEPIAEQAI